MLPPAQPCGPERSGKTRPAVRPNPRAFHHAPPPIIARSWFCPGRDQAPAPSCRRHAELRPGVHALRSPVPLDPDEKPFCLPSRTGSSDRVPRPPGHRCPIAGTCGSGRNIWRSGHAPANQAPGRPRSIGNVGIGGWVMVSQSRQLILGRAWTMTLKYAGTYSSTSRSSTPIWVRCVPPQEGQAQAASCSTRSRGR